MKLSSLYFAITILFIIKLSITTGSSSSSDDDIDGDDDIDDDPRIRHEIRELSSSEWRRIANAINIMKATSNEDGKEIYGDKFETYDSIVCRHALAVGATAGDQAHFTPAFFTVHRTLLLLFEEVLRLIDPEIEGIPYWDYKIDTVLDDLSTSPVFTDEIFGSLRGDPNSGYRIVDGPFHHWKINDDPNEVWEHKSNTISCPADNFVYRNAYGLLRGALNPNDEPYVTRVGGYVCGEKWDNDYTTGDPEKWDECIDTSENINELENCIAEPVHNAAHYAVGGQVPLSKLDNPESVITPNDKCVSWMAEGGDLIAAGFDKKFHIQRYGYNHGCFECPWDGDENYSCEIGVDSIQDCAQCELEDDIDGECTIDDLTWNISGEQSDQWIIGDFNDFLTGINDPFWFFHHANVDRVLQEWLEKHPSSPYYGFPTFSWPYGQNLNDPVCGNNGCQFYDFLSDYLGGKEGPYTHKDILYVTRVDGGLYEYH